ncbi:diguanylate cyclase domain-containing protein [Ideonella sp.]|uniref:diguanylate cyclase domain-containing protein n=1 Tax=Ideonella sp. TaxID=1929293 RepID=UPI002B47DD0A|nr:diguanylate cyclase [Ideonella sp.]HJV69015.1 diguanylate cyclase [Ideonella sp.]
MKVKLGIAWRLGLALAGVGVLAAALTGYYGYTASRTMLIAGAEERLQTATRVLVRQLAVGLNGTARDVRLLANHPQAARLLARADPRVQAFNENNVEMLFERLLDTHPEYFQMRLIDVTDHGLERIRVDRDEGGLVRVSGDDLQEKGHYPYVFETLRLPPGAVYVSRPAINHEVGAHAGLGKPSLQVAAPVHDVDGRARGVVVINVDLNGLFAQLAADLPPGLQLYLTNSAGDFLIHPDPAQAFAFDRGQVARLQDAFPAAQAMTREGPGRQDELVTTASLGAQGAVVAAFMRQPLGELQREDEFILGLAQPLSVVLKDSEQLGAASARIVVAFSALAVLLAALLARAMTRPLNQIVDAVRRFAEGAPGGRLPSARQDEIGLLARSIEAMQSQIRAQFATLEQKQGELDRLASHDSLTGLHNRRFFLDRLDHALAHAKRTDGQLALLFIDLDNFKAINDELGHAAGDHVLRTLAQRLKHVVREVDTVARIGGDEFIILLDEIDGIEGVSIVAHKVLDVLSQPVRRGETDLVLGASIGASLYPENGEGAIELIAAADQAMYRAKSGGRMRVCLAGDSGGADTMAAAVS